LQTIYRWAHSCIFYQLYHLFICVFLCVRSVFAVDPTQTVSAETLPLTCVVCTHFISYLSAFSCCIMSIFAVNTTKWKYATEWSSYDAQLSTTTLALAAAPNIYLLLTVTCCR
jgi:hypothetical protein